MTIVWTTTRHAISLDQPKVMAIVNATPDSFSDSVASHSAALQRAQVALNAGADILDIGAESTRPGAKPVPLEQEWGRLEPVLREVLTWGVPISVDTYKPAVMQRALDMGVDIINDVWALRWRGTDALCGEHVVAAHSSCGVCLMHMNGEPATMQISPMQGDAVPAVAAFLAQRVQALTARGVATARLVLDPGIGFGKTVDQNFSLLTGQLELQRLGLAVLAGWSRKSSLGAVTGRSVDARAFASVAAATLALQHGARVLRVHDVAPTKDAVAVYQACVANAGHYANNIANTDK
jgi:dihydropteroate synthase